MSGVVPLVARTHQSQVILFSRRLLVKRAVSAVKLRFYYVLNVATPEERPARRHPLNQ